jgi:hypothetical protein
MGGARSEAQPIRQRSARVLLGIVLALAPRVASCASLDQDRHLAPLFTEISRAGGGVEIEALGGAIRTRYIKPNGPLEQWALRPIVIVDKTSEGATVSRFLTPFGRSLQSGGESYWELLPIARYDQQVLPSGELEWTFLSLPGIYWARRVDGRTLRAVFPFAGVLEDFLSYDRLFFFMFPLYARSERDGRVTYSVLFPVFAYTTGENGGGWRFWPFFGTTRLEGSYERSFALWPIFHWQRNNMWEPPEHQEVRWMIWPLLGRTTHGSYHATSVLWPFFGWSSDPRTNMWSWDGPWPFIRIHHDPQTDLFRTRVWPFYSHFHGDGLDSDWYLWPIVNIRHEEYPHASKDGLYILPFWQSWDRNDEQAGKSSFRKLWPLYQVERTEEHTLRAAFPALNPLWRTPEIDEMYAWIYELYSRERNHEILRERSWLGLYRHERDALEDRAYLVGLWARRRYGADRSVAETSLLFGLLRWRKTASGSLQWLPPAMPGPGWPLLRGEP